MLKLNCLIKNTVAVQHMKDAIEILVGERMETSGIATFPEVYNDLRRAGLEVDAESAGALYDALYGGIDNKGLSTTEEVSSFAGKDFEKQLNSIVDGIQQVEQEPKNEKLGTLSPEKHAVNSISKLFAAETFGTTPKVKSVMRQMQDLVTKAATSLLPKSEKKSKGLTETLDDFFDVESNQFRTLDGQLNTLRTLHNAVKKEVENYVDQAAEKLSDEDANLLREQWGAYTEAFMNSTYDIVLNKGNQNSLVNEALKQIQIDGTHIVDINGNVKWSALIEFDNPDTITEKVKELFREGFKNPDGTITSYSPQKAERVGEYFKRLYLDKLDTAKQRAIQNNRVKNKSAKNIISDFIKERGFFNLVKDKDGKLLLTQTDWDNAIKYIKKQIDGVQVGKDKLGQEIRGLDLVENKLRTWLNAQTKPDGSPKFTEQQKQMIENEFVDTVMAKLDTATNQPVPLDRLIALNNINNGTAFNEETQQALNKVVGVSGLDQQALSQIQQLVQLAQTVMNGNNVTGSTNPNPAINRGAYAFTALTEIDRKIKEVLREYKIDKSGQQRIAKYLADIMGGGTVSLLLNPNNIIENIFTQFATNIAESFNLMFTNPKLFAKTFGKLQGDFWTQWVNYAQGGASNEVTNESDLSSDLQSSERLRVRGLINEFDGGFLKGLGSAVLKFPAYVVSLASRTIMNSFDAATTTSLMRKRMIGTVYNSLINQGNSPDQALQLMDKAYNIPANIKTEIEAENARIGALLKAAGFPVNSAMMNQNARDLRLSLYEDILQGQALMSQASLKQGTEITKALIESSQSQAKALGGKKQLPTKDPLSQIIYAIANGILTPQKVLYSASRNAENRGDLGTAAKMQIAGSIYQNSIGKFVGGVANFMNLAITSTPLGFITGATLRYQRNSWAKDHPGSNDIFNANPEDVKRYAEFHGLMRSVFTRAIMGSTVMAAFITKGLAEGHDDEDESWFANLMKTKTGRRFIQKHLPMGVAMSASAIYGNGKDNQLDMVFNMLDTYTGQDFDRYKNLRTSLKYAKTDEDREEVWAKFWGNLFTTYNVNQLEQIIRFKDAFNSAFDSDEIKTVEENEKISKNIYRNIDGIVDGFLINGAFDAFRRGIDPEQKVNRFSKKDW
ncbi:MAG TPA: hypothetical protein DIC42_03265 [Holosporales bacterium]|nr:hypothetical protein [Holosporales bacterium]